METDKKKKLKTREPLTLIKQREAEAKFKAAEKAKEEAQKLELEAKKRASQLAGEDEEEDTIFTATGTAIQNKDADGNDEDLAGGRLSKINSTRFGKIPKTKVEKLEVGSQLLEVSNQLSPNQFRLEDIRYLVNQRVQHVHLPELEKIEAEIRQIQDS